MSAISLYKKKEKSYYDYCKEKLADSSEDLKKKLSISTTLYVGNLSFHTTEQQIWELFSKCGNVQRIIMGLNKNTKQPCGFCFVQYYTHEDALNCVRYINGTRLDDRVIRTELDVGFKDGRQYGRGVSGGQVRDDYRTDYDPGRGGWSKIHGTKRQREETEPTGEPTIKIPKTEEPANELDAL